MKTESPVLKNILFFSLSAHLILFSLFSFSFGRKPVNLGYANISFWGTFLRQADLAGFVRGKNISTRANQLDTSALEKINKDYTFIPGNYFKPQVSISFEKEKREFLPDLTSQLVPPKRKDSVIVFHPQLPYDFLLYFKDRQEVHIELLFKISHNAGNRSVAVKRKISSGNLEADLLAMRYIHHYLFLQEARLPLSSWQPVKIDLGLKAR